MSVSLNSPGYEISLLAGRYGEEDLPLIHSAKSSPEIFIPRGGIQGFSANAGDVTTTASSIYGQIRHGGNYGPITGSIQLVLKPLPGPYSISTLYNKVMGVVQHEFPSTLVVKNILSDETFTLPVRLSETQASPQGGWGWDRKYEEMTLSLISDDGYWEKEETTRQGDALNLGDLPVFPVIEFTSAGGDYEISDDRGNSVTMNTTSGLVVINTDPMKLSVTMTGVRRLDRLTAASVLANSVPPMQDLEDRVLYTAKRVSDGSTTPVTVRYNTRHFSPWR